MLRCLLITIVALTVVGCDVKEPDQELRVRLFERCLANLPAGPTVTMYNDWDEVVDSCASAAYYQSLR